jgi:hypothetical protein
MMAANATGTRWLLLCVCCLRVCCPLSVVHCLLSIVCCLLSIDRCPLSIVHCPLSAVRCLLSIVCESVVLVVHGAAWFKPPAWWWARITMPMFASCSQRRHTTVTTPTGSADRLLLLLLLVLFDEKDAMFPLTALALAALAENEFKLLRVRLWSAMGGANAMADVAVLTSAHTSVRVSWSTGGSRESRPSTRRYCLDKQDRAQQ